MEAKESMLDSLGVY